MRRLIKGKVTTDLVPGREVCHHLPGAGAGDNIFTPALMIRTRVPGGFLLTCWGHNEDCRDIRVYTNCF